MNVLDSSALLAWAYGEQGSDTVDTLLDEVACCSAANWSETAQKATLKGAWPQVRAALLDSDLKVEPVTQADAERAATFWSTAPSLSLGDRLCLATAERLDAVAWTADTAWGESDRVRQIR